MPPLVLAYYCSGHGYGHATRVSAFTRHLLSLSTSESDPEADTQHQEIEVHIVSSAPAHVFQDSISRGAKYRYAEIDPVIVQPLAYLISRPASLHTLNSFLSPPTLHTLLTTESSWLTSIHAKAVLTDTAFLACLAAHEAGVPSVLVTNFTFDSVYSFLGSEVRDRDRGEGGGVRHVASLHRLPPSGPPSPSSPGSDGGDLAPMHGHAHAHTLQSNPHPDPPKQKQKPLILKTPLKEEEEDTPLPHTTLHPLTSQLLEGYALASLLVLLPGAIPIPAFPFCVTGAGDVPGCIQIQTENEDKTENEIPCPTLPSSTWVDPHTRRMIPGVEAWMRGVGRMRMGVQKEDADADADGYEGVPVVGLSDLELRDSEADLHTKDKEDEDEDKTNPNPNSNPTSTPRKIQRRQRRRKRQIIHAPLIVRPPSSSPKNLNINPYTPQGRTALLASLGVPPHLQILPPGELKVLVVSFGGQVFRCPAPPADKNTMTATTMTDGGRGGSRSRNNSRRGSRERVQVHHHREHEHHDQHAHEHHHHRHNPKENARDKREKGVLKTLTNTPSTTSTDTADAAAADTTTQSSLDLQAQAVGGVEIDVLEIPGIGIDARSPASVSVNVSVNGMGTKRPNQTGFLSPQGISPSPSPSASTSSSTCSSPSTSSTSATSSTSSSSLTSTGTQTQTPSTSTSSPSTPESAPTESPAIPPTPPQRIATPCHIWIPGAPAPALRVSIGGRKDSISKTKRKDSISKTKRKGSITLCGINTDMNADNDKVNEGGISIPTLVMIPPTPTPGSGSCSGSGTQLFAQGEYFPGPDELHADEDEDEEQGGPEASFQNQDSGGAFSFSSSSHTDMEIDTDSETDTEGESYADKDEDEDTDSETAFDSPTSTTGGTPRLLPDESWIAVVCGVSSSSRRGSKVRVKRAGGGKGGSKPVNDVQGNRKGEEEANGDEDEDGEEEDLPEGFYIAPRDMYMPDLMAVADVVLGKLGYGTVSECVDACTPFVYVSRPLFIEEHGLRLLLDQEGVGVELSREGYERGEWAGAVEEAWVRGREGKEGKRRAMLCVGEGEGKGKDRRQEEGRELAGRVVRWVREWWKEEEGVEV